jgi:lysozyme
MCFQMGKKGVVKFVKFHAALKRGDFNTAADEMLDSKWAKQTPDRAKRLAARVRALTSADL